MKMCLNILIIFSILISVCFLIVCIISYFENRQFRVTEYTISSDKIRKCFHQFYIVHISDLHNACYGEHNSLLIHKIQELKPDVILVTGDMIVGKPNCDVKHAADTLKQFAGIAPVYMSMGNHELRTMLYRDIYGSMWDDFSHELGDSITILQDECVTIQREEHAIYLHGLNLTPELYKRFRKTPMKNDYLNNVFGMKSDSEYHIFMAHNPDYFEDYAAWGADLTLSGHVHGGMIRLPILGGLLSPMIRFFPRYDKGVFEIKENRMVLSGGLGNHTYKFRVNNYPEIVSIHLESLEK